MARGITRLGPDAGRVRVRDPDEDLLTALRRSPQVLEMAERSEVRIRLESERFPAIDGALDLARSGVRTSGDPRNREFAGPHLELDGMSETLEALAFDPQTAGGLLVSVPAERGPTLEAEFMARRLFLRRVGRVEEGSGVVVE